MSSFNRPISLDHWVEKTSNEAIRSFAKHQIFAESEGRWVIRARGENCGWTSNHLTEIVSLYGGRLFVGGDIDDCVFAYFGRSRDCELSMDLQKVQWIGRCEDLRRYVLEKAKIGLTDGGEITMEWVPEVAQYQLENVKQEYLTAYGQDDKKLAEEVSEVLDRAIELAGDGEPEYEVWACLRDLADPELLPTALGRVPSARVVYAWAACRRLCELLSI